MSIVHTCQKAKSFDESVYTYTGETPFNVIEIDFVIPVSHNRNKPLRNV